VNKTFACVWVEIWGVKMTILLSPEAEAKFTISIISNDTCYWKYVHRYWSHNLSNYCSWVSASLNTNHFNKITKDDLPKFSSCYNTGIEQSPKFSSPRGVRTGQFGQAMAWPLLVLANPTIESYENLFISWSNVIRHMKLLPLDRRLLLDNPFHNGCRR